MLRRFFFLLVAVLVALVPAGGIARADAIDELLEPAELKADEVYRKTGGASWGDIFRHYVADAPFARSYALVISVSDYQEGWQPLTATRNDPDRMRDLLVDQEGFDLVITLRNERATKERIEFLMRDVFPQLVEGDDRFLFYFSGHGTSRKIPERGEVGYLPLAASGRRYSRMISMGDIRDWDRLLGPAKQVLFLLDACFSGLAGLQPKSDPPNRTVELLAAYGHHLMTAGTGEQETIAAETWGGSIFTDSLIKAAEGRADARSEFEKDGVVSLAELEEYVRRRVGNEAAAAGWRSRITPQLYDLSSDNEGEFFFVTREKKLAAQPQARLEKGLPVAMGGPAAPSVLPLDLEMAVGAQSNVNVRAGPGTEHVRIDRLAPGATVEVTGRVEGMSWYRVALPGGRVGYVLADALRNVVPSAGPVPAPARRRRVREGAASQATSSMTAPTAPRWW